MLQMSFENCFYILRYDLSKAEGLHTFSLHPWNGSDSGRGRKQFPQGMGVLNLEGVRDTRQIKKLHYSSEPSNSNSLQQISVPSF